MFIVVELKLVICDTKYCCIPHKSIQQNYVRAISTEILDNNVLQ